MSDLGPLFAPRPTPGPDAQPGRNTPEAAGEVSPPQCVGGAPAASGRCTRYRSTTCLALHTIAAARCADCSAEGELLKERGMAAADAAEDSGWKSRADAAIETLAASGVGFTSEDVRAIAGAPSHFNAMGARFVAAAKRGLIRKDGHRKATRAAAQATELTLWVGK